MAVHLATSSDYLQRTTALLPASGDSTVCFWVKSGAISVGPAYQTGYIILDDPGVYTQYAGLFYYTDGGGHCHLLDVSGSTINTLTPTVSTWIHYAWVQSGTSQRLYRNGALVGSVTVNRAAYTPGFELLGNDTFADGNLSIAYCREWTTALTQAQILDEMQALTAVHTANLWMDCPLTSNAVDISGNGHSWTSIGAPTFVAGPSFPSNSSIATATAFSTLPQTITQDFGDGLYAWYAYTGHTDEVLFGAFALSNLSDSLELTAFNADGSSTGLLNTVINRPALIPIMSGVTIYLKVEATAPPTDPVTVSLVPAPTSPIPAGSIFINDEAIGFPAAVMAPGGADYQILNYVTFPSTFSENGGDILDDGTILIGNDDAQNFQIYDGQFALVSTVTTVVPNTGGNCIVKTCAGLQEWYIGDQGGGMVDAVISRISAAGVETDTWTLPNAGLISLAASNDGSLIYVTGQGGGQLDIVKRWVTATDSFTTDLVPHAAGVGTNDLLVLPDDTILVMKDDVRRYATDGTLLNTYAVSITSSESQLFQSITPTVSFWARNNVEAGGDTGKCFCYEIKITDGTILNTVTQIGFASGAYLSAPTLTPLARFGPSQSCPSFILREAINPPAPTGEPTEYLIRRERWFPVISSGLKRQFFSKLQIDMQTGNGLSMGQGSNPLMEIDWSDDSGWTWSNIRFVETGRIGAYGWRPIARNLSYGRNRVFRIAVSDPVQWIVLGAELDAVLGLS